MEEEIEIKNAVIKRATITRGERGFLDAWLELDYGGAGQGFGGYCLYLPKSFDHHKVESVAGHHIFRIMEVADVEEWGKLIGKTIRVKGSWNRILAIGHIVKSDWFSPQEDYKALNNTTSL